MRSRAVLCSVLRIFTVPLAEWIYRRMFDSIQVFSISERRVVEDMHSLVLIVSEPSFILCGSPAHRGQLEWLVSEHTSVDSGFCGETSREDLDEEV